MIAAGTGRWLTADLDPEVLSEQAAGPSEVLVPGALVLFPADPEVREVIQEEAEHPVTVSAVLGSVHMCACHTWSSCLVGTIVVPGCSRHSFRKHRYKATPWSASARLIAVSPGSGCISL
jgi:hypothetical protein